MKTLLVRPLRSSGIHIRAIPAAEAETALTESPGHWTFAIPQVEEEALLASRRVQLVALCRLALRNSHR